MRILFTKTVQLESEGRNQGPVYKEGEIHDFPEETAQRWLRRNVAVPAPENKFTEPEPLVVFGSGEQPEAAGHIGGGGDEKPLSRPARRRRRG